MLSLPYSPLPNLTVQGLVNPIDFLPIYRAVVMRGSTLTVPSLVNPIDFPYIYVCMALRGLAFHFLPTWKPNRDSPFFLGVAGSSPSVGGDLGCCGPASLPTSRTLRWGMERALLTVTVITTEKIRRPSANILLVCAKMFRFTFPSRYL